MPPSDGAGNNISVDNIKSEKTSGEIKVGVNAIDSYMKKKKKNIGNLQWSIKMINFSCIEHNLLAIKT